MLRVRAVGTVEEFLVPGDGPEFAGRVEAAWEDGTSCPEWCVVVERGDEVVGRVGFTHEPSTSDPAWLGTLPPTELHAFGLHWDGDPAIGRHLLRSALPRLAGVGPAHVEVRVNRRHQPWYREQVSVLASMGELFQEKAGYELDASDASDAADSSDASATTLPDHLRWADVDEVGVDRYARVMGRCGEGTIDRNDAYYWGHCGADNWGRQMMAYLTPEDADMWLLALDGDDEVGYVAIVSDPEFVSTIGHIGVVPEARGNGHVHDLLAAVRATLARRGITSMLSDVDVFNRPMVEALLRAGHEESDWHVWHFRCPVGPRRE